MRPIRIQKAEKTKTGKQRVDLSPGVSVSGADLYAGFCTEGCLSFWRKFGAGGRWSPSVYSLYRELSEQLGKGTDWTWSAHAMGYNFYGFVLLLSLQSVQLPNTAVYEIHVCKRGCHCGDSDQGRALQRIHGMVFREKISGQKKYGSFSWLYVRTV